MPVGVAALTGLRLVCDPRMLFNDHLKRSSNPHIGSEARDSLLCGSWFSRVSLRCMKVVNIECNLLTSMKNLWHRVLSQLLLGCNSRGDFVSEERFEAERGLHAHSMVLVASQQQADEATAVGAKATAAAWHLFVPLLFRVLPI